MSARADVVAAARGYLNTPFFPSGRLKDVGIDCAGLLICVARELGIVTPDFDVPAYLQAPDGRSFVATCDRFMDALDVDARRPGDAVVVAVRKFPTHIGIVASDRHGLTLIHASNARSTVPPRVIETRLVFHNAMRPVGAYAFRGLE